MKWLGSLKLGTRNIISDEKSKATWAVLSRCSIEGETVEHVTVCLGPGLTHLWQEGGVSGFLHREHACSLHTDVAKRLDCSRLHSSSK